MRAVVLGARGAVGRETVAELHRRGHASLTVGRTGASELRADVTTPEGREELTAALRPGDVVINASGREDRRIADLARTAPLVEISASGSYLEALAGELGSHGVRPTAAVLGAGIAPGLSTALVSALASRPGDDLDVGVTLGSGERHGDAAMAWTQSLIGTMVHRAPESESTNGTARAVPNFRESRRLPGLGGLPRSHLRADFPDHVLVGRPRGTQVRSYLALSSPALTPALGLLSRAPRLAGAMRVVPAVGSQDWRVVAVNRRTAETLAVEGRGQSRATGILAVLAAERIMERTASSAAPAIWTMAELCTPEDATARLGSSVTTTTAQAVPSTSDPVRRP